MYKVILVIISMFIVFTATAKTERDPTKPFAASVQGNKAHVAGYTLFSVIISENSKTAIINDIALLEGGAIGEYTVDKILKEKVILRNSNETLELTLF